MVARVIYRTAVLLSLAVIFLFGGPRAVFADMTITFPAQDGVRSEVVYSLEELRDMPQITVVTDNDFVDGETVFEGPLARSVIEKAGGELKGNVRLTAANDYVVEVPAGDFVDYDVILSLQADGVPLSRRDKGPVWLIYPMSSEPDLQVPATNSKLIWQLVRMDLE